MITKEPVLNATGIKMGEILSLYYWHNNSKYLIAVISLEYWNAIKKSNPMYRNFILILKKQYNQIKFG